MFCSTTLWFTTDSLKLEGWSFQPTPSTQTPLLAGFRTYETSLLVEEAISEELPYSGKIHFMMPPQGDTILTSPQNDLVWREIAPSGSSAD